MGSDAVMKCGVDDLTKAEMISMLAGEIVDTILFMNTRQEVE